ncbi:acylphosphatase [Magnetospirillum fulvum]|uniref:Acylphosphatase n=1 Tax=Magnetospirillum fulvum TaxID=1082 RepID=A0A1H6GSH0_MAGFU|nr:acylphosphatase [Magnetospirillum fulvum]
MLIEGRVQGVWFRGWTVERATASALSGWVRNRSDGSVEALFSGPAATVEAMVAACRIGPPAARVSRLLVEPAEAPAGPGFHQRPTV